MGSPGLSADPERLLCNNCNLFDPVNGVAGKQSLAAFAGCQLVVNCTLAGFQGSSSQSRLQSRNNNPTLSVRLFGLALFSSASSAALISYAHRYNSIVSSLSRWLDPFGLILLSYLPKRLRADWHPGDRCSLNARALSDLNKFGRRERASGSARAQLR